MVYPLVLFVKQQPALAMMLSLYVTLGIFLLLAARDPSQHRSLIARGELIDSAVLVVIGVALIVLAPAKRPVERSSVVAA